MKIVEDIIERGVFGSRWLLVPVYAGLIVAQVFFAVMFCGSIWTDIAAPMIVHGKMPDHDQFIGAILFLLDMVMVANLVLIILIGGYATFVSKLDLAGHVDRPAWLDHIDPGTLKTKLAGSLVGVSGIHLLQAFIDIKDDAAWQPVMLKIAIHITFTVAVVLVAWSDLMVQKKVQMEGVITGGDSVG